MLANADMTALYRKGVSLYNLYLAYFNSRFGV